MKSSWSRFRWLLGALVLALVVLILVVVFRTARFATRQLQVSPVAGPAVEADVVAERLGRSIQFPTIAYAGVPRPDDENFLGLRAFLEEAFPRTHDALSREIVSEHSLLYTWNGDDDTQPPILLAAHLDVVPVAPLTESEWRYPPFSGTVAEGFIWGRGTLDDKVSVLGILEAVEGLLHDGFQPRRTIFLAFGQDEEVGGERGAQTIAALLKSRGVQLACAIDEGSSIIEGVLPGLAAPVALVGIAEKGYVSIELVVEAEGGHSSMPPPHTAIGVLSRAITRLEARPMPAGLTGVARLTFDYLGPEMPFAQRLVFANLWLFRPLVERRLAAEPSTNALIRTTTAVTKIHGGFKENVLPEVARAVVNFRLLPGDTIDDLLAHVHAVVDDPQVNIALVDTSQPLNASRVSDIDSRAYAQLETTIREVFPDAIVAPFLVTAGTDGRYYEIVSTNVYRFLPIRLGPEDLARIHGTNERIAVANYVEVVRFYDRLIRNLDSE